MFFLLQLDAALSLLGSTHPRPLSIRRSSSVLIDPEVGETLAAYLSAQQMLDKVANESRVAKATYAGIVFEPKPYSEAMPRGLPADLDHYLDSDRHVVVNVPPIVMFHAKCFKPAKLCAIYELDGARPADVSYSRPSTADGGAIGLVGFDYGDDDDFEDQLL